MAKRFTDTERWKKPFIRSLQAPYKLLWFYICDDCDHAGIWQVDLDVAQIRIGEQFNVKDALAAFGDKVISFDNGTKWFIPSFIEFQYGELKDNNRVHDSVIKILKKYNLIDNKNKTLSSPLQGDKDKDKDKDKYKDKDKESAIKISFDIFWDLYDKKVGEKQKLIKKWDSLKYEEQELAIKHIPNYKVAQPDKKYRKDPQTYLNNKSWNDEVISSSGILKPQREAVKVDNREYWQIHYGHLGKTKEEIMEMVANGELE